VEVAELLGVRDARARRLLAEMVAEGTVVTDGGKRNRVYKLRA
jgi:DNA-binding IclR family transcriptional regulator